MKGFCLADGGLSQRWTAQYQRCPGHSWLARRWEQLIRPRLGDDAGDDDGDDGDAGDNGDGDDSDDEEEEEVDKQGKLANLLARTLADLLWPLACLTPFKFNLYFHLNSDERQTCPTSYLQG